MVTLSGSLGRSEQHVVALGRGDDVLAWRRSLQEAMRPELTTAIQATTGRRVVASMGMSQVDPEYNVEVCILEPEEEDRHRPRGA